MRFVTALLAAIVLSLSAASPTLAQNPHENASRALANKVWGSPCGGFFTIMHGRLPLSPDIVLGRAWHGPFPAGSPFCVVTLNDRVRLSPGAYCTTVLHEAGHLDGWLAPLGQGQINEDGTEDRFHSRNPRSVMAQGVFRWPLLDRRCRHIGRTYNWTIIERGPRKKAHLTVRGDI